LFKTCSKCGETKTLDEFCKDKGSKDGLYAYCKQCNSENVLQWQKDNPEKCFEKSKRWRKKNLKKYIGYSTKWAKANPEKVNVKNAERRAAKNNLTPWDADNTLITRIYKEMQDLNKAADRIAWHVDHVQPLSKGGLHHQSNLQLLQAEENVRKGAKLNWKQGG